VNEVGQGAGAGARTMLLVVLATVAVACLIGAPVAGAATGSLASIERNPNFAWSALNITAAGDGFAPVADDPVPWTDAATGQLCAAAITPTPAGHVITWCRTSDDAWHQWDMTALWGGPAGVGDVRAVADFGQSVLFYRDAGGEMWSLTRQAAGTWTAANLTGTYGFTALASDPWPLIDLATGQLCAVAATAPAGHVTEWCHQSNDAWLQFDLTAAGGAPAAVGTVVPGTDPATNQNVDFFRDASGELWSLTRQASAAWVSLDITARSTGLSPIASDPMPVIDPPTGQLCVVATLAGATGHVAEFCRQSDGSWLQFDLTALYGGAAAAGDVQPLVDPQLNQTAVYFRDAGGNLWSLTRGADGRWTPAQIVASGATPMLVSDPEPLVDPQTNEPMVLVSGVTPPSTPAPPVILTTPTPKGPRTIRARFVIKWRWDGLGTVLRSIRVRGLPPRPRLAVSCAGPDCPRIRGHETGRRRIVALLARLAGQRFAPGDVVRITVTAPGLRAERIQLRIRRQRVPLARLLTG
jgi:hypothetical protein